jgi:hypothetical protein
MTSMRRPLRVAGGSGPREVRLAPRGALPVPVRLCHWAETVGDRRSTLRNATVTQGDITSALPLQPLPPTGPGATAGYHDVATTFIYTEPIVVSFPNDPAQFPVSGQAECSHQENTAAAEKSSRVWLSPPPGLAFKLCW